MQRLPRFGQKNNFYEKEKDEEVLGMLEEFLGRKKKSKKAVGSVMGNFEGVEVIEDKAGIRKQCGHVINGRFYVFPEEALFLIGKGNLVLSEDLGLLIRNCGLKLDYFFCYGYLKREGVDLERSKEAVRDYTNENLILHNSGKILHILSPNDVFDPDKEIVAITSVSNPALLKVEEFEP